MRIESVLRVDRDRNACFASRHGFLLCVRRSDFSGEDNGQIGDSFVTLFDLRFRSAEEKVAIVIALCGRTPLEWRLRVSIYKFESC